ncbi:ftz transcription factor 1 [Halyomorpha halys]|nr:ftz transcription factor 1 [Halyomorpha halys]
MASSRANHVRDSLNGPSKIRKCIHALRKGAVI